MKGARLHYVERGAGDPVVLLHGNGRMIQDFDCCGLLDLLATDPRIIVFDRPGFGHSDRPRSAVWTPDAQAELIEGALSQIGVSKAIILGHSWGASVAVALALKYTALVLDDARLRHGERDRPGAAWRQRIQRAIDTGNKPHDDRARQYALAVTDLDQVS